MLSIGKTYAEQISTAAYLTDFFYAFAVISAFLIIAALTLIEGGLVARKHMIDVMAQKLICSFIAATCSMFTSLPLWMWQFNQALQVPRPLAQAFADWWPLGHNMVRFGHNIDPATAPHVEVSQIFAIFFFAIAGIFGAYVHSMGTGRLKPAACFMLSAFGGGVLVPVLAYLTWGPVSPLTNNGLHDFVGALCIYMPVGVWSVILAWRLGPRLPSTNSLDAPLVTLGVFLLMAGIPGVTLGSGYLVPEVGYFGISNTTSGIGIVFINIFVALGGGAVSGAIIGYRTHKPVYVFLSPIAGYVCCTALLDIAAPWQCFLIAMFGPLLFVAVKEGLEKLNLDDQKIAPLTLGTTIFSVLMAGIVGWGVPTGGMPGGAGEYAFQHAQISLGMQALGILVVIAISAASGLALIYALEKTIGLRIPRQIEQEGIDQWYWNEWRKSRKMRVSPKQMPGYKTSDPVVNRF